MRGIKIIDPGFSSTIQDNGRTGYREYGLPCAGAMDKYSFYLANWLVRNQINEAVIETTFHGLEIEFLSQGLFAITGANTNPILNGGRIELWETYKTNKGDLLKLSRTETGTRSYLSFGGGFRIDHELGSLSTYLPGQLGGYRGRELRKGDILPLYPSFPRISRRRIVETSIIPEIKSSITLKVLKGVDYDRFHQKNLDKFFAMEYSVTNDSNRMGIRLKGEAELESSGGDLISYAIHPGTIQLPPEGNPIIMGSDCQTVGGYPQIVNIISSDLHQIGQLMPGHNVRFELIESNEAYNLLKSYDEIFRNLFKSSSVSVCTDCIEKRR